MRTNTVDASRRAQTGASRSTLRDFDDGHDMMEIKTADVTHGESPTQFENWQNVGMTTYPKKQQQSQGGSQGGGGSGGGNLRDAGGGVDVADSGGEQQPKGPAAEGMMSYMNGSRAHPICTGIDDRRVRPYGMKEGEGAFYAADGSGQMLYHRMRGDQNDGCYLLTCDQQQGGSGQGGQLLDDEIIPIDLVTYNGHVLDQFGERVQYRGPRAGSGSGGGSQQSSTRFVSVRHVNKQKQKRNSQSMNQGQQGGSQGGQQLDLFDARAGSSNGGGSGQQDYKHEGDSVNTEMRVSKNKIEFFAGGSGTGKAGQQAKSIGYYDVQKQQWNLNIQNGGSMVVDNQRAHISFGGNSIFADSSGCWSTKPIQQKGDSSAGGGGGSSGGGSSLMLNLVWLAALVSALVG